MFMLHTEKTIRILVDKLLRKHICSTYLNIAALHGLVHPSYWTGCIFQPQVNWLLFETLLRMTDAMTSLSSHQYIYSKVKG